MRLKAKYFISLGKKWSISFGILPLCIQSTKIKNFIDYRNWGIPLFNKADKKLLVFSLFQG